MEKDIKKYDVLKNIKLLDPNLPIYEVYHCPFCRVAYRTDRIVGFNNFCKRCKITLPWQCGNTLESIEKAIGIPMIEWIDLTKD